MKKKPATTTAKTAPQTAVAKVNPSNDWMSQFIPANTPLAPLIDSGASSPYIQFLDPKQNSYSNIIRALANAATGDSVYVSTNNYTLLKPMVFVMLPVYFQFYAKFNSANDIEACVIADENFSQIPKYVGPDGKLKPYRECIDTVILAYMPTEKIWKPARCRFAGPKVPAFKRASAAMLPFFDPNASGENIAQYAKESKEKEMIVKAKLPTFMYYVHTTSSSTQDPRDKSSGEKEYVVVESAHSTPTIDMLTAYGTYLNDEQLKETCKACFEDHKKNVDEITAKAAASQKA